MNEENKEVEKAKEIFILMNVGKMTITEINTLTDNEKSFLSKWFMEKVKNDKTDFYKKTKNKEDE